MFKDASIGEIVKYLFIVGVVLGFFQMVPGMVRSAFKWVISRLKKEKVEELRKQLGSQCMSETECQDRLKAAVKEEISVPLRSLEQKMDSGMNRIHERIDEHLNSATKKEKVTT